MKAISSGNTYEIFDDSLQTFDKLPTQTYILRFNKNKGFFLEKYSDIEITESKIYGVHLDKVHKVLHSFDNFNRNLGVILSGDKGIGKSLFAKLLAIEATKKDIPVIVVDTFVPGIASYLESIKQEVMVLFDEFDKTFCGQDTDETSPQAHMLSLFDGVSNGKKLFVITCNEFKRLNDYLINRPGRFHYHFRFEYPSAQEVREYLEDKIPKNQYGEIDDVISFSRKINLNYDCLRAIAFEISMGLKFKDAIKDLNIVNVELERYDVTLYFSNGMTATAKNANLDLFYADREDDETTLYLHDKSGDNFVDVTFNMSDCRFDPEKLTNIVLPEDLQVVFDDSYEDLVAQAKAAKIEYLELNRRVKRDIHYAV